MINHDAMNEAIGQTIRKARKSKKITQQQLADMVGISRTTIVGYELGDIEISMLMFIRICEALGVNYADVLQSVPVIEVR